MSQPVAFHFDFISPYAYLAWTQIHALAARHGREVVPIPTLFAALLNHGQTKGPAEIPAKRAYAFADVTRSSRALGVALSPPPSHPFNPLVALRVASLEMDPVPRRRLIDGLFKAAWGGGGGVETREQVAAVVSGAGLDAAELLRRAEEPEAKHRLRTQTDAAIAGGVFGVPTMIVDGEMFWGLDSFGHLERQLRGEGVDTRAEAAKWLELPASATRK